MGGATEEGTGSQGGILRRHYLTLFIVVRTGDAGKENPTWKTGSGTVNKMINLLKCL